MTRTPTDSLPAPTIDGLRRRATRSRLAGAFVSATASLEDALVSRPAPRPERPADPEATQSA